MSVQSLIFEFEETVCISPSNISSALSRLMPEIERIQDARAHQYTTPYAAINVPFDNHMFAQVQELIKEKEALRPTMLVVIAIGGSHLGTRAIQEAVAGVLYNTRTPSIAVYYAQTIDPDELSDLMDMVKAELQKNHAVIINVISKSGTTLETVINFELFLSILKEYAPQHYRKYVVVTTQEDSPLWQYGKKEHFSCLAIPHQVGGRYSVFTPVGLFPLGLLGIDIHALRAGAQQAVRASSDTHTVDNQAALSAVIIYLSASQKYTIHDMFLFSVDLAAVGQWYRQLMAESLGKKHTVTGALVETGITPTVSIGTVDLHSVAQLYLAGPRDKLTTFVTVQTYNTVLTVPSTLALLREAGVAQKALSQVMHAFCQGVQASYKADNRPFMTYALPEKSAYYVGEFLQLKMIEMMYLGYLFQINPFDQPQVELYKKETRKILRDE
jgi:glucose-6-phosphate isomerase